MVAALALMPVDLVEDCWFKIMEVCPNHAKLTEFLDSVVSQWLDNEDVPLHLWNVCGERHRTNNAVGGWNRKFNALVGRRQPNIYFLIDKLKAESIYITAQIQAIEVGFPGQKRRKKYIQIDERLEKIMSRLQEHGDVYRCLKALSYIIKLD